MKEQRYIIKEQESFELKDIFECGQCFRWNEQKDGSYIGVFGNNVLSVKKQGNQIIFEGICEKNIKETVNYYFDLSRNYEEIKSKLSKIDENMKESIKYGKGIRLLNQDLWETIISFIISANNNIPRIKKIIERISEKYGKEIEYKGKKYYTFPKPEDLKDVTPEEYRKLGLGFRDIRLFKTTQA
ncbi:MAG: 8-oxoguanine DNA glycosylase, partial [Clostridia bacterium]|nr:8-oxoguanine DNA glycosylase [Clostridia bacterium]